jgi:hypothetical protein
MRMPFATAVGLLCTVALVAAACRRGGTDWRILQLYSGETSVELLRRPAKVQAFRLDPTARAPTDAPHVGPYVASGPVVDVPAEAAAELAAVLAEADSYDWRRGPKALRPTYGFQFVRGAHVLEVALDLDVDEVAAFASGRRLGPVASIAPSRARLDAVVRRVFPDAK